MDDDKSQPTTHQKLQQQIAYSNKDRIEIRLCIMFYG